jgi:hypothetical protein
VATGVSESQYDLINRADLDGLVRLIDDYCETRSWHDLLGLRDACKAAVANGRQVWPASTLAEYRLALLAPAEIAVQVVDEEAGRFTMGPLTEVIPEMGNAIAVPVSSANVVHDSEVSTAFHQLVDAWTTQSNGELRISCVEGSVLDALASLDVHEARLSLLSSSDALAWLTWAGASGGAHGRRRGNALGRDAAWWTIAALTVNTFHWPLSNNDLETAVNSLQWFWWDTNEPATGWQLQLCIHHADRNRSWAISVHDWK